MHGLRMSREAPDTPPRRDLPELRRVVEASRHRITAVRGQKDGAYCFSMSFEGSQALAGGHLPEAKRIVPTSRQGVPAIRTQGNQRHVAGMSFKRSLFPTRVPGGASPAAFTATVKAWGNEVADGKGAVLKCKRDGLFLGDNGRLNESLQAEFWYQCRLFDEGRLPPRPTCQHVHTTAHDLYNGRAAAQCNDCGRYVGTGRAGP